ncbi:MAG: NAD(P)-dependent oxidoreductase [Acidobacteria bacterium]|nr:NAD(P)-dependent oxidoreductase [Acidobacteriota bacterium]
MIVGLIGHGLLGSAIAERLTTAGHTVAVYDLAVASSYDSVEAVAAVCEALFLCLPDSSRTAAVLSEVPVDRLVIDTTTGSPEEMGALGVARPLYVDATIGGSSNHLRRGEAIVMAGASETAFEKAAPLLAALSSTVIRCGGPGSGARMKLVFNMVLGLNRAALAEGLAFGEAQGLPGELILRVLQSGPASSRIMETKGPKMLARDYAPEARLRQHHKDVQLMLLTGARAPLTEVHERILAKAEAMGLGDSDNSALIEVYRRDNVDGR